jgi:acetyl-CoA synthetase
MIGADTQSIGQGTADARPNRDRPSGRAADRYDDIVRDFRWNIPRKYNLGEAASDHPARAGHGTAILVVDEAWRQTAYSFQYLSSYSNRLANMLAADGFVPGDRIAVILPASIEAAVIHLAVLKSGMISVPILPDHKGATSFDRLAISGAAAVFTSADLAEENSQIWSALPELRRTYPIVATGLAGPPRQMEQLLSQYRAEFTVVATTPATPALLGFTSGSEGLPKGVLHAHSVVLGGQPAMAFSETPQAGQIAWSHFEWGWLGGLLVPFGAWHYGSAVVLHHQPTLLPGRTIELFRRVAVNHVSIAPTALKMLRSGTRSAEFPQLTSITSGGEKLDLETREWVRSRFGIPLSEIYGLSECGAVLGSGHILSIREGAIGKPAPGQKVHIISDDGEKLPDDQPGFIAVEAPHPSMFLGYWNDESATAARYRGALFNTGDVAYRDADGYFWYVARGDDLISSAGRRIGPAEIEEAFLGFPCVELCAAVGVPNPLLGEAIVLWIKLQAGQPSDAGIREALFAHARKTLALYQLPHEIRFVEALPLTATGKVHRRAVREQEIALQLQR